MTAFEWLKTLDLGQNDDVASDPSSDSDAEKDGAEVREETWKLIDDFDGTSSDEDDDDADSPHGANDSEFDSAGDGDAEGFSSGTDGELQPKTPRAIEMEASAKAAGPASVRTKVGAAFKGSHPTLRSMRALRNMQVISQDAGSDTPSSEDTSAGSPQQQRSKSARPVSLAVRSDHSPALTLSVSDVLF